MLSRRNFVKGLFGAGAVVGIDIPSAFSAENNSMSSKKLLPIDLRLDDNDISQIISKFHVDGMELPLSGIPSGLTKLAAITREFNKGDLIFIGGVKGIGKSLLAMNIARYVSEVDYNPAIYINTEPKELLINQLGSIECDVDYVPVKYTPDGGFEASVDMGRLKELVHGFGDEISEFLIFDGRKPCTVADVEGHARGLLRKYHRVGLVVVDTIQPMGTANNNEGARRNLMRISDGLKAIAMKYDVPVIAFSTLVEPDERRTDKMPTMDDLYCLDGRRADKVLLLNGKADHTPAGHRDNIKHLEVEVLVANSDGIGGTLSTINFADSGRIY